MHLDYKAKVWNSLAKSRIKIEYYGPNANGVVLVTGDCDPGKSMSETFKPLEFNSQLDAAHQCPVTVSNKIAGEISLSDGQDISTLFLKYGEKANDDGGNIARVMLSTNTRGEGPDAEGNIIDYSQVSVCSVQNILC